MTFKTCDCSAFWSIEATVRTRQGTFVPLVLAVNVGSVKRNLLKSEKYDLDILVWLNMLCF